VGGEVVDDVGADGDDAVGGRVDGDVAEMDGVKDDGEKLVTGVASPRAAACSWFGPPQANRTPESASSTGTSVRRGVTPV
jgi:hypothetical protein